MAERKKKKQRVLTEDEKKLLAMMGEVITDLRKKHFGKSYERFALEHNFDRKQYWRMENGCNCETISLSDVLKVHKMLFSDFYKLVEEKLAKHKNKKNEERTEFVINSNNSPSQINSNY